MKHTLIITFFTLLLINCVNNTSTNSINKTKPNIHNSKNIVELIMPTSSSLQERFDTLKLGRLYEGEKGIVQFNVFNQDTKPLVITHVITGCGCTHATYDKAPIMPNKSKVFTVTFDSKNRFGTQLKTIEIINSEQQVARIYLLAEIISR